MALERHLQTAAGKLDDQHLLFGTTPLTWATLMGRRDSVQALLARGADVNGRNRDGSTALHAAAFFGRAGIADLLIDKGADIHAASRSGEVPLGSAGQAWDAVQATASLLHIPVERQTVEQGREQVAARLRSSVAVFTGDTSPAKAGEDTAILPQFQAAYESLVNTPVFGVVWFLWFLVWLVAIFAVYAVAAERSGWQGLPPGWVVSPWNLLVLVLLTMVPGWFMGFGRGEFGPDASTGLLPLPWVLAYYALFFFFGALYHDCDDQAGRLGRAWRRLLPVALLVVFPVALETATGVFGFRDRLMPAYLHQPVSVMSQALYAWLMAFGCMGMFRSLIPREHRALRYLSDSSYWLYLAHLPLVIWAQSAISEWRLPALVKLVSLSVVLIAVLLLSYDTLVRHTWMGSLLNGPRERTEKPSPAGNPSKA